jgi:segregation and condensation protein B
METIDPFSQAGSPEKEEKKTEEEINANAEAKGISKVEAALFVAGRWLSLQELISLTDINPISIKEHVQELIEKYNKSGSGIQVLEKENMWKMDVKPEHASIVNKLITGSSEFTKAEQETLAVIAYKQPVKQSVIIKIRGNKAYDHIKRFIQLGLLSTKKEGHTLELELSEEFYNYFHVSKDSALGSQ